MEPENIKRGRGRPTEEDTRRYAIRARFDSDDMYRLEQIEAATKDTVSDIVRIAVRGYYIHLLEAGVIES